MIKRTVTLTKEVDDNTIDTDNVSQGHLAVLETLLEKVKNCCIKISGEEQMVKLRIDEMKWQKRLNDRPKSEKAKYSDLKDWMDDYEDLLADYEEIEEEDMLLAPETDDLAAKLAEQFKLANEWFQRATSVVDNVRGEEGMATDAVLERLLSHPTIQLVCFDELVAKLKKLQVLSTQMKRTCRDVVYKSIKDAQVGGSLTLIPGDPASLSAVPLPNYAVISKNYDKLREFEEVTTKDSITTGEADLIAWYQSVLSWITDYLANVGYKKVTPDRNVRDKNGVGFTSFEAQKMLSEARDILGDYPEFAKDLLLKETGVKVEFDESAPFASAESKNAGDSPIAYFCSFFNAMQKDYGRCCSWEKLAEPFYEDPELDHVMLTGDRSERERIEKEIRALLVDATKLVLKVNIDMRETLADVVRADGEVELGNSDEEGYWEDESDSDDEATDMVMDHEDGVGDGSGKSSGVKRKKGRDGEGKKKRRRKIKKDPDGAEKARIEIKSAADEEKEKMKQKTIMVERNRLAVENRSQTVDDFLRGGGGGEEVEMVELELKHSRFLRTHAPKKIRDKTRSIFENVLYYGHSRMSSRGESPDVSFCVMLAFELEAEINEVCKGADYKKKVQTLNFNLTDDKNPLVVARVLSGEIGVKQLVSMTSEDMASESVRKLRENAEAERLKDSLLSDSTQIEVTEMIVDEEEEEGGGNGGGGGAKEAPTAESASAAARAAAGISETTTFAWESAGSGGGEDQNNDSETFRGDAPASPTLGLLEDMTDGDGGGLEAEEGEEEEGGEEKRERRTGGSGSSAVFDPRVFASVKSRAPFGKFTVIKPMNVKESESVDAEFRCYALLARSSKCLDGRRPVMENVLPDSNKQVGLTDFEQFYQFFKKKMDGGKNLCVCIKVSVATCSPGDKDGFKATYKEMEKLNRVGVYQASKGRKEPKGSKMYLIPPKFAPRIQPLRELGCTSSNNQHTGAMWLLYINKKQELSFREYEEDDDVVDLELLNKSKKAAGGGGGGREEKVAVQGGFSPIVDGGEEGDIEQGQIVIDDAALQSALDMMGAGGGVGTGGGRGGGVGTGGGRGDGVGTGGGRGGAAVLPDWLSGGGGGDLGGANPIPIVMGSQNQFEPAASGAREAPADPFNQPPPHFSPPPNFPQPSPTMGGGGEREGGARDSSKRRVSNLPAWMEREGGGGGAPVESAPTPVPAHVPQHGGQHGEEQQQQHGYTRDPDDRNNQPTPPGLHDDMNRYSEMQNSRDWDNANALEEDLRRQGVLLARKRSLFRMDGDNFSRAQIGAWSHKSDYVHNCGIPKVKPASIYGPSDGGGGGGGGGNQQHGNPSHPPPVMQMAEVAAPPHPLLDTIATMCAENDSMLGSLRQQKADQLPFLFPGHADHFAFVHLLKSKNPSAVV